MKDQKYYEKVENALKQMLEPIKDIPFNLVIEKISGQKVLDFDERNLDHAEILVKLKKVAKQVGVNVNKDGIKRSRPNEVGNDIEEFVKESMNKNGLTADVPADSNGNKKAVGYPDIIFKYKDINYYLECKTFSDKTKDTTQRSFYLSPSEDFKVVYDAVHFLLSYETYEFGQEGTQHVYKCKSYKILSLESLSVDVKHEFNSDNRRLYSGEDGSRVLAEENI